ncbi:MFS transporter [Tunturiibacter gelidiferens]|uniref:MFS transporter n=1 Tax=Tunturiibacter gelidiferens TaxID=3069689 RepID=UPI003D9B006A
MLALIVRPALTSLGDLKPGTSAFNLWVGLLFFIPVAIGGVFGLLGGYLADLVGRRRVLVWSILLYAFSASAASYATSVPELVVFRCTTMIGVSVEYVAALAWLAELFPYPKQRESVLAYTQSFYALGGLLVVGAYYLAVTYAERFPTIRGGHEAWRYTLLSGIIPAIPLIFVRPFLPESPVWREKKSQGTLKRPRIRELFRPALRRTTLITTLLVACTIALGYGALQHTVRIVPGLAEVRNLAPRQVEQTVSNVQMFQELGSLTGRAIFALLVVRIVTQRRRLRICFGPMLIAIWWLFSMRQPTAWLYSDLEFSSPPCSFNGLHSFWGNYLPRVYPTHLRGTGESFAVNIGGKTIGVSAALLTTQLANVMPGSGAGVRLSHAAGTVALLACVAGLIGSFWLPEPEGEQLPD